MEFKHVERQALIVWVYTLKQLKEIRKLGHVQYVSKKMRYVVLYVDKLDVENVKERLKRFHFVKSVEESYRDLVDMTWKDAIPNRIDRDKNPESKSTLSFLMAEDDDDDDIKNGG